MANITIESEGRRTRHAFEPPMALGDVLRQAGFAVDMPCGGRGRCAKCLVHGAGALSGGEMGEGMYLACQARALGDVQITLGARGDIYVETGGAPDALPVDNWGGKLGAAIDLGTTTLAAYLYDLDTGARLGIASAKNPQAAFGADVISRISASLSGQGAALQSAICQRLKALLSSLSPLEDLDAVVVTGNTAMLYLMHGDNPDALSHAPFEADELFGKYVSPGALGLSGDARLYAMRSVSAYVGADIAAAALAADLDEARGILLLCDIGTNGEMILYANGKLYGCSTAAGPAFEGAGLSFGMAALPGAITRVRLEGGALHCTVLGDGPARGICGSGVVDALCAMLDAGILDETGRIEADGHAFSEDVILHDGHCALRLPGTDVLITQSDVRSIQLAKSALCAGMLTLIDAAGVSPDDVEALLIAGGFGSCIDPRSAERIGLIPEGFCRKARAIGNAAGAGASMALLSMAHRIRAERIARATRVIALDCSPHFESAFVECMLFPE